MFKLLYAKIFIILLFAFNSCSTERIVLGVKLNKKAWLIKKEIEEKYNHEIVFETRDDWEPIRYGSSRITLEGVPMITLNSETGISESTIVHELFHLKYRYPTFYFLFPKNSSSEQKAFYREYLPWIKEKLYDPIIHSIFYPEIKAIGVTPYDELKVEFEGIFKDDSYFKANLKEDTKKTTLALTYMKARLEIDDENVLSRLDNWYEKNSWSNEMNLAERLYNEIKESKSNPREVVNAFLNCLNIIHEGELKFVEKSWETVKKGQSSEDLVEIALERI